MLSKLCFGFPRGDGRRMSALSALASILSYIQASDHCAPCLAFSEGSLVDTRPLVLRSPMLVTGVR